MKEKQTTKVRAGLLRFLLVVAAVCSAGGGRESSAFVTEIGSCRFYKLPFLFIVNVKKTRLNVERGDALIQRSCYCVCCSHLTSS